MASKARELVKTSYPNVPRRNENGKPSSEMDTFEGFCQGVQKRLTSRRSVELPEKARKDIVDLESILVAVDTLPWLKDSDETEEKNSTIKNFFVAQCLNAMLFDGGSKEERAVQAIQTIRYSEKHSEVLSIMAGEVSKEKGIKGIQKLMKTLDTGNTEPLGLQHLKIKMQCLQQCLLESDPSYNFNIINKKISKALTRWLERGMVEVRKQRMSVDDTILKEVVVMIKDIPHVIAFMSERLLGMVFSELERAEWNVHSAVVEALGWIINTVEDNEVWLKQLQNALGHPSKTVREATTRRVSIIGQTSNQSVAHLLKTLEGIPIDQRSHGYDKTVIKLLLAAPEQADTFMDMLVSACKSAEYWTRQGTLKAIPGILSNAPERLYSLACKLLPVEENYTPMSPGAIEVLGVCLEMGIECLDQVFIALLVNWRNMGEDGRQAMNVTLKKAVKIDPEKAIQITEFFTSDHRDFSEGPHQTLKTIVDMLGEIPEHANAVVDLIREKYEEVEDKDDAAALMLEAARNIHVLSKSHQEMMTELTCHSFKDNAWSIRSQAYKAASAIIINQPASHENLFEAFLQSCQEEHVWKAQCVAFEAAAKILSKVMHPDLLALCHESIGDKDDVIRCLAAEAVKASASAHVQKPGRMIEQLVSRFYNATEDEKHGIVHCLHLFVKDLPEMIPKTQSVFIDAARHREAKLLSASAVAALSTLAASHFADNEKLIDSLKQAIETEDRGARFDALEGLTRYAERRSEYNTLIQALRTHPNPMNNNEWTTYLHALAVAVRTPRENVKDLIEKLLPESIHELPNVHEIRRKIVEDLSISQLLEWYKTQTSKPALVEVTRRFFCSPMVLDKNCENISDDKLVENSVADGVLYIKDLELRKKLHKTVRFVQRQSIKSNPFPCTVCSVHPFRCRLFL